MNVFHELMNKVHKIHENIFWQVVKKLIPYWLDLPGTEQDRKIDTPVEFGFCFPCSISSSERYQGNQDCGFSSTSNWESLLTCFLLASWT